MIWRSVGEVGVGLFGSAHVRLGNDFAERRAAAVVVNVGLGGGFGEAFMQIFGGVFFKMEARDADALLCAFMIDLDPAICGEGQLVLRDLVALGQIGIEIVFAGEARMLVDGAIQGERGAHGQFDSAFVQNRQRAGQAEADRAHIRVGRIAEAVGAGAENLGVGQKLDVDFQADDGLVFREDLGGDGGLFWR